MTDDALLGRCVVQPWRRSRGWARASLRAALLLARDPRWEPWVQLRIGLGFRKHEVETDAQAWARRLRIVRDWALQFEHERLRGTCDSRRGSSCTPCMTDAEAEARAWREVEALARHVLYETDRAQGKGARSRFKPKLPPTYPL